MLPKYQPLRVVMLGSGAVATHLSLALVQAHHEIVQVYSRNLANAEELAKQVQASAISNLSNLCPDADIYIVSIKDDAIASFISAVPHQHGIWVHTAGSVDMEILQNYTQRVGVLYPLQTFSKSKSVDFKKIPIGIEASNSADLEIIRNLALSISEQVTEMNAKQRGILHVSAVFACNFVNFMYSTAQEIMAKEHIPFEMIRPLILETAEKAQKHLPKEVQTGPAVRNDIQTLKKHEALLAHSPQWLTIYKNLSQEIAEMYR